MVIRLSAFSFNDHHKHIRKGRLDLTNVLDLFIVASVRRYIKSLGMKFKFAVNGALNHCNVNRNGTVLHNLNSVFEPLLVGAGLTATRFNIDFNVVSRALGVSASSFDCLKQRLNFSLLGLVDFNSHFLLPRKGYLRCRATVLSKYSTSLFRRVRNGASI